MQTKQAAKEGAEKGAHALSLVDAHDALLHGALDEEALDGDGALLAHAPRAADGLVVERRVHQRLHHEDIVGRRQVDAHRTAAHRQDEHLQARAHVTPLQPPRVCRTEDGDTTSDGGERTVVGGSFWKASMAAARCFIGMLPEIVR